MLSWIIDPVYAVSLGIFFIGILKITAGHKHFFNRDLVKLFKNRGKK